MTIFLEYAGQGRTSRTSVASYASMRVTISYILAGFKCGISFGRKEGERTEKIILTKERKKAIMEAMESVRVEDK